MPLYLRTAIAATVAGVAGLLVWAFSAQFIGSSSNARLRDTMPMVGSAMMSVCSLMFMISAVLAIVHAARGRKFSWTHGLVFFGSKGQVEHEKQVNPFLHWLVITRKRVAGFNPQTDRVTKTNA